MPFFRSADEATTNSYLAVFLCILGSVVGIGVGRALGHYTSHGYLPVSGFLLGVFTLLTATWAWRRRRSNFDPSATFAAYVLSLFVSLWALRFFFIDPALGPFADELWSVPALVTNAAFGIVIFALAGTVLGITYHAARRTYGEFSARRALYALIGIGLPLLLLVKTEYFLANFQI